MGNSTSSPIGVQGPTSGRCICSEPWPKHIPQRSIKDRKDAMRRKFDGGHPRFFLVEETHSKVPNWMLYTKGSNTGLWDQGVYSLPLRGCLRGLRDRPACDKCKRLCCPSLWCTAVQLMQLLYVCLAVFNRVEFDMVLRSDVVCLLAACSWHPPYLFSVHGYIYAIDVHVVPLVH